MNKISQTLLFLALLSIPSISKADAIPISNLNGEWALTLGSQDTNCLYYFNMTMKFQVDEPSSSITEVVHLLDAIKNSYNTYTNHYTYKASPIDQNSYILNKNGDSTPYTLKMYDANNSAIYQEFVNENNHRSILDAYGIQKTINPVEIYGWLKNDFPNFPWSNAGIWQTKPAFQLSTFFNPSQLEGKQWFSQANWQKSHDESQDNQFEYKDSCQLVYHVRNWQNGIAGLPSKENFNVVAVAFAAHNVSASYYSWVYYPDPVIPSWIHQDAGTIGIAYADDNVIIEIDARGNFANLFTTNPNYSSVTQTLFYAQLVKAGVNPTKGKMATYNSSYCDPKNFDAKANFDGQQFDIVGVVSTWGTDNSPIYKRLACLEAAFSLNTSSNIFTMTIDGNDLENMTNYNRQYELLYKESSPYYLYPIDDQDHPFEIVQIHPGTYVMKRDDGDKHEAYGFTSIEYSSFPYLNQFMLGQYYEDLVVMLPYTKYQCNPIFPPIPNVSIDDILSNSWYALASYQSLWYPSNVSCWKWSILKNETEKNLYNINALGYLDYNLIEYTSTNSVMKEGQAFLIPQVQYYHADFTNSNTTQLALSVLYYDGDNVVLGNQDMVDGVISFFFLSKQTTYSSNDQATFKSVVTKSVKGFDLKQYHIVNNEKCGFNDEEIWNF